KGYSSLNYLKQLPISTLKIDKSFIDTIESDSKHKSLTNVIVKLGRIMGLSVVAEGVETKEQLDYLTRHRCDKVQGYLFSKPVPGEKVIEAIRGLTVSFR
ncbi:MAG TPA: EAL domain-containing protein, partial [Bacillota bacterium]|nr:EAL domain-containing protein [Bacillota bacterium]